MSEAEDRVGQFLEGGRRNRRDILTPEGVSLPVDIAPVGERVAAFALDLVFWFGASLILFLLAGLTLGVVATVLTRSPQIAGALVLGVLLLITFIVRVAYFIHFELAGRGATPGKRALGLRVIDRQGGPLLPSAVIARNLMREIEAFLPLSLLTSLNGRDGAALWETLFLGLWLLLFGALSFFNRDRMRAGDFVAGTIVVALPRRVLLDDLVATASRQPFTDSQLRAYGTFELQILEELLRRPDGADTRRVKRDVCDRICRRIAWAAPVPDGEVDRFLRDFYAAERAFLEREQLFGKRHADKHDQKDGAAR
ncbi:MAG TPA: RDD family protein [Stellaceae bacterium]|nr:RDD family protein [Stellaceae bacterium]